MKAVRVERVGSFELLEVAVPAAAAGEVLLRVGVAGLCRTDLKIIRAGHRDLVLPRIPGEEVVGTAVALGEGVEGVSLGDVRQEARRFLEVLGGRNHAACREFTCLNAAAVLFVGGRVDNLRSGYERSRELIETGAALQKLRQWVSSQASDPVTALFRFEAVLESAD